MEIDYNRVGDYLLRSIALSDTLDSPPLERYGLMHKNYLRYRFGVHEMFVRRTNLSACASE